MIGSLPRRVLVIVPAYNEGACLGSVLDALRAQPHDVLVVDDGSIDATANVARRHGVAVLQLPFNLGIGGAVQAGFQYAVSRGYDVAVQFDGDGQHRVEHLPALVEKLGEGWDVVIGSRFLGTSGYKSTPSRVVGIKLFSWICSRLIGTRITDCTSGFRALSPKALRFCARWYAVDFPDIESLLLLSFYRCRITEIPVTMNVRLAGRSSTGLIKSIYYPFSNVVAIASAFSKRAFVRRLLPADTR